MSGEFDLYYILVGNAWESLSLVNVCMRKKLLSIISTLLLLESCSIFIENKKIPENVLSIKVVDGPAAVNAADDTQKTTYVVDKFKKDSKLIYDYDRDAFDRIVRPAIWEKCYISWGLRIEGKPKIYYLKQGLGAKKFTLPDTLPPALLAEIRKEIELEHEIKPRLIAQLSLFDDDYILASSCDLGPETLPLVLGKETAADTSKTVTEEESEMETEETVPAKETTVVPKTASEAVTEEKEKSQTGGGTPTTGEGVKTEVTTEESAEVGAKSKPSKKHKEIVEAEETEPIAKTQEKEAEKTITAKAEAPLTPTQIAQKRIDDEAKGKTVKITVAKSLKWHQKPSIEDIHFGPVAGLKFGHPQTTAVNDAGRLTIVYVISADVKDDNYVIPQGTFQTLDGFETKAQHVTKLKQRFKEYFGEVFPNQHKVLSLGKKAVSEGTVYALTFGDIQAAQADGAGRIVLPCALWKSQANGMFNTVVSHTKDLQKHFAIALNSDSQLVLGVKEIDGIEGLKNFFTEKTYRVGKDSGGVTFKSPQSELRAFTVPRRRRVNKEDLLGKKFHLEELAYFTDRNYPNYRELLFMRETGRPRWEFQYHNTFYTHHKDWGVRQTDTHERRELLYQDMRWDFKPETGWIHAWVDNLEDVHRDYLYYGSGTVHAGRGDSADDKVKWQDYPWIKNTKQFSMDAYVKWSDTIQDKLVLKPRLKPRDGWPDYGAFWFMDVDQRLEKLGPGEFPSASKMHFRRQVTLRQSNGGKWRW